MFYIFSAWILPAYLICEFKNTHKNVWNRQNGSLITTRLIKYSAGGAEESKVTAATSNGGGFFLATFALVLIPLAKRPCTQRTLNAN